MCRFANVNSCKPAATNKYGRVFVKKFFYFVLSVLVILNASCFNESRFGKVTSPDEASVFSQKSDSWKPLKKSHPVFYGDTILSKDKPLEISFANKSTLTLEPNTKLIIIDSSDKKNHYIFPIVFYGGVISNVKHKKPDDFTYIVYTPVAYAQPNGSHFYVSHSVPSNVTDVHSYDGNVIVYNLSDFNEPTDVNPGYTTVVNVSGSPIPPKKLKYDQFRRIGYMIEPEMCKHYCVLWGFPVIPIAVPVAVPVPVVEEKIVEERVIVDDHRDYNNHNHQPRSRSRVNVNVNVNANVPGFGLPMLPVPVMPVPVPHHVPRAHYAPVPVPPIIAPVPVPVPVPGRPHHHRNDNNNGHRRIGGPPMPVPPVPVPGHGPNPFRR